MVSGLLSVVHESIFLTNQTGSTLNSYYKNIAGEGKLAIALWSEKGMRGREQEREA